MAGAGGGLAGGLWAFAGAALRPGAALVLDTIGFDAAMRESFAVVTGEGGWTTRPCAARPCSRSRPAAARAACPATRSSGVDALDAFGTACMNIEVEAAARDGAVASERRRRARGAARWRAATAAAG